MNWYTNGSAACVCEYKTGVSSTREDNRGSRVKRVTFALLSGSCHPCASSPLDSRSGTRRVSIPSLKSRRRERERKCRPESGLIPEMAASGHARAFGGAYELLRLSNQINRSRTIPSTIRHDPRPPPRAAPPRQSDRVTRVPDQAITPPVEPIPAPPAPAVPATPAEPAEPAATPSISISEPEPVAAVPEDLPEPAILLPEEQTTATPYNGSVSKVPSSKFGRLLHYGGPFLTPLSCRDDVKKVN